MTKYGLRTRVIIFTLAPTLIIGALSSAFFIYNRSHDLEQQLSLTGQAIIEPLAIAIEIGLSIESRENVRRLIGHTHRQHSQYIRTIAVFTDQNELFVTSNYHRDLDLFAVQNKQAIPDRLEIQYLADSLLLRAPIRIIGSFNSLVNQDPPIGYIAIEMDLSQVKLEKYQEAISVAVAFIFGIILAGLFAYRLLLDVEMPINQMISMIDKIRRGHLNVRIEGKLLGEVDVLKNGINAMAISLSEYHIEMQQSIDQATSDLRETLEQLEIQNIELDIAKKSAQEATKVKSEFIANMSHELRTPLNSVLGFTRQILKTQLSSNQEDYLQTIEKSANSLLYIINDILDFSKLEAGKFLLESIPFDLEETVDDVMRQLALMAHEKGLDLNLHISPQIPMGVIGDPKRLQQVLTNLIGNATKFTEQGYIRVSVELKHQRNEQLELQFFIRDTGIGISEQQQAQLFQAFRQADASINRRYGGTGLGLVITQKLIQQMGGKIGLSSHLNQGSTFWFTLPLIQTTQHLLPFVDNDILHNQTLLWIEADAQNPHLLTESLTPFGLSVSYFPELPVEHERVYAIVFNIEINDGADIKTLLAQLHMAKKFTSMVIFCLPTTELALSEQLLYAGASACLPKPLSIRKLIKKLQQTQSSQAKNTLLIDGYSTPLPANLPPPKAQVTVMALDDNPANLKLISTLLHQRVSHVVTADDGRKAVNNALHQRFDLILMDIQMPELDGVSACKEIRKTALNANTPIVAVTAHAIEGERERLLAQGMDDYLTKPIDEKMLEQILQRWIPMPSDNLIEVTQQRPPPLILENTRVVGINWPLAIQHAGNKEDLAKEMLQMLVFSFDEIEKNINLALNGKPIPLSGIIHKLHGSCAYSGVPTLQKLCAEIETRLNQHASIDDIEPELFELLDEIHNIRLQANNTPEWNVVTIPVTSEP